MWMFVSGGDGLECLLQSCDLLRRVDFAWIAVLFCLPLCGVCCGVCAHVRCSQVRRGPCVFDSSAADRQLELRDMQLQSRGMSERTVAAASSDSGRPVSAGKPASRGRQVRGRGPCVFDSSAADRQLRQAASAVSATSRGAVHKSRGLRHSLPYIEQRAARQVLVRNH